MIEEDSVTSVLDSADIVDVAMKLIPDLKKSGSSYKAKSPFTDEKSGSFFIVPHKQIFKCFSSGLGGGVVKLVMKLKGFSYPETIEWLADLYNIELRRVEDKRSESEIKEAQDHVSKAKAVLELAHKHWQTAASVSPEFEAYMNSRGVTKDDIVQWGIAFSPNEWKYLTEKILKADSFMVGEEIGLIKSGEKGNFDVYRNRIIFPLHSSRGDLIGFAGRLIVDDKDQGKYINPKESFLYNKSKVLYGLHFAETAIRKIGRVNIVEGYLDVIAMHRMGQINTVAPCGTALTELQAKILKRSAKTVRLLMDGDKAGVKAMMRTLPILLSEGLSVQVANLPDDHDPDSYIKKLVSENPKEPKTSESDYERYLENQLSVELDSYTSDAIAWFIFKNTYENQGPREKAELNKNVAELIACIPDKSIRQEYVKVIAKSIDLSVRDLKNLIDDVIEQRKNQKFYGSTQDDLGSREDEFIPDWALPHEKILKRQMFIQKRESDKNGLVGLYFPPVSNNAPVFVGLDRVTNFTIEPLYQVIDERNGRWMAEVYNSIDRNTVELQDAALVESSLFLKTLVSKRCYSLPKFSKFHFQWIVAMLVNDTKKCHELKTLGHQPEDFFAFSNAVIYMENSQLQLKEYDSLGIVEVKTKNYLSSGVSSVRGEQRGDDDMYENDLYLKYVKSKVSFAEWADIFCKVYDDHGRYGVAFALLSIYKDMIYRIGAKCPLLYLYGPKGSGKSAMGESIMFLFYSGKNAEGRLIQAVNMSPGMLTDFALASALQRFRNCPRLYNEYDPNATDQKYRGWIKAAFDGEGRERGMGDSGGKRKTEIMKVQGTVMLAGQYMDTGDDGAVMTRSINLPFSEEKNKARTQEQKDMYAKLHDMESEGLAGCLAELIGIRGYVMERIKLRYYEIKKRMATDAKRQKGRNIEERLLNNYALCYSFCEVVNEKITIPFNMLDFYTDCIERMVQLSGFISDGSVINRFWDVIEFLIDNKQLVNGREFDVETRASVLLRTKGGDNSTRQFQSPRRLIFIRLSSLYGPYAKEMRARGARGFEESTVQTYLSDQPYFLGLCPRHYFKESGETSAYVLDRDLMISLGIDIYKELSKEHHVDDKPKIVEPNPNVSMSAVEEDI